MSLLDNVLDLGPGNIAVGIVSALMLFSVFFKDKADFLESIGGYVAGDVMGRDSHRDDHWQYLKLIAWAGLSILMMFASAAFFDPYPKKIEFSGEKLSVREDNNDTLLNIEVFTYRNYENTTALTIAMPGDSELSVEDFRAKYIMNLESQGIQFVNRGGRYIGTKGQTKLYLTEPYSMSALLILSEQSADNNSRNFSNTRDKFAALESFEF